MKLKIKKWFEKNKDKIFIWFCVGLIAIIVLLVVLFQRSDVENININNKADIILNDDFNYNKSYIVDNDGNLHSQNLIDISSPYSFETNVYTYSFESDIIEVDSYYTLNFYFDDALYSYSDFSLSVEDSSGGIFGTISTLPYTFYASNTPYKIVLNFEIYSDIVLSNFMLNVGSDSLPYEIYGAEYMSYDNYGQLQTDYNTYVSNHSYTNTQYITLYNSHQQLLDDYATLQYYYNQLQTRYNNLDSNYTQLQSDYNTLNSNYTSYVSNHSYTNTQYNTINSNYTQLQSDYNLLNSNYTQLQSDYNSLNSNYTQLQNTYNTYVTNHSYTNGQYNTLNSNYTQLQSDYNSLNSNYTQLQSDYNSLNSNYNSLSANYTQLQSDYNSLDALYTQLQADFDNAYNIGYSDGYNEGINSALLNENNNNILLSSVVVAKGYQNNSLLYTSNQFDSVYDDNFKLTFLTSNIGYNPLNESDYLTSIYFEFSSPITINSNYFCYINSLPSPNYHLTFYLDDSIILDLNYQNDSLPFPITFNNEYTFNRVKVYNTYSQENQTWNASFGTLAAPYWYYLGSGSQVSGYASGYQIGFNDGLSEGHSNGYQEGLNSSYSLGYQDGYNVGIQQDVTNSGFRNLFNSILSYPINFISSVFNFEFMGINVASVVLFLVSIGVVLFVIKRLWK